MYVKITDKNGKPIEDIVPLPVKLVDANGNAIQTDEDGNLLVKQTGSKAKITPVIITRSTEIGAGASETITVMPTEGYMIKKVLSMRLEMPAISGSTGQHRCMVGYGSVGNNKILQLLDDGIKRLRMRNAGEIEGALTPDADTQQIINTLMASSAVPLVIYYQNGTDKVQSGSRTYDLYVYEEAASP